MTKEINENLYILGEEVVYGWVLYENKEKYLWNHNRYEEGYQIISKHKKVDKETLEDGKIYIVKTSDCCYSNSEYFKNINKFSIELSYPVEVLDCWEI